MHDNKEIRTDISDNDDALRRLGWGEHFEGRLAVLGAQRSRVARVVSVQRNHFLVRNGRGERLCTPAGKLLHGDGGDYPVTGDWVLVDDSVVGCVLERRTLLARAEAGSRGNRDRAPRQQPIAANLDTVFIVCGLDRDFNVRRLERYLTLVHNCALSPVMVLTKADLHEDAEPFRLEVEAVAFGVPVVVTSMLDGRGRDELERFLGPGRTVAMVGSSGAGKSTLANMLLGGDVQATNTVSASDGKGRHTTTVRELIAMPQGGMLMDNPGIREIAFHENGHGAESAFPDIQELAERCRFADCTHQHEPGCAVLHAAENGELPPARLESYRKMQLEMRYLAERSTKSAGRIEKEKYQGIAQLRKSLNKSGKRR